MIIVYIKTINFELSKTVNSVAAAVEELAILESHVDTNQIIDGGVIA